jgi:ATP/maltotriose-dependent transcriptional regulator MalT
MDRVIKPDDRVENSLFAPVERQRLFNRLADSASLPITLLIAPAGYGKSVALHQYLGRLNQPHVLFTLRREHASLLSFLRGFTEALQKVAPHAITSLAGAYERQGSPKRGADLAGWMHAHLESFRGVVAIDDLHIADEDEEVSRFLSSLIDQSKDAIRWILASRATTSLPVGSWIAYRDAAFPIDEHDLRFTFEEAKAAAVDSGLSNCDELRYLLELTDGWPAAISFAIRTTTRSWNVRNVSAVTREMLYRLLAEQVYSTLNEEERNFLEIAAALPSIDIAVLEGAGFDRALQIIERLRARTAFIHEESRGIYQCHDLFREFLRHQTALAGKISQRTAYERAGRGLEASGDIEHAISAYAVAASRPDVFRLLQQHGFDLLERARSDVVSRAIDSLDEATRRDHATILALRGALQAVAGKFAKAESLLRRSLVRAGGDRELVAAASLRLGAIMANQGHDVSPVLQNVGDDVEQSAAVRAEAISLIAGQLAVTGSRGMAMKAAARAEEMLPSVESEKVHAKVLHRVGIAYHHLGMGAKAFDVLTRSCELAEDLYLFGLASRVNAVLSNLALHERDDVEQQLAYAKMAARAATKAGDAFALQTALLQMLSAEMRRGNVERSIAIEQRLTAANTGELVTTYVAIFRSARLAWEGRFSEARHLLASCWAQMTFTFDRITCGGIYALFLALDGSSQDSGRLVKEILDSKGFQDVTGLFRIRATGITRALCALTESINGRAAHADRILRGVRAEGDEVVRVVVGVVERIMWRAQHGADSGSDRVKEAIEKLRGLDYGDVAQLLSAIDLVLANIASKRPRPSRLTPSEIEVLGLLQRGVTPKEIAQRTSRSVSTVRVHIANAITKLGCHGHSEAIRVARRLRVI